MKIVIAPDSFKGSLSANEVCDVVENAILKIIPTAEIIKMPVSDGGEGLVNTLVRNKGDMISLVVKDPLFREITAKYGILNGQTAVIEMAAAAGLPLLAADERNPLFTTTYGVGEMIVDAVIKQGCKKIILGLGGSATNDGGLGVATALGIAFLDKNKNSLSPCGENLSQVVFIDSTQVDPRFNDVDITIACDVENSLCGEQGAARVYGPQKGATAEMVSLLDQGLNHFGKLLEDESGKNLLELKGIGAAGGMALPLVALFNAHLKSGLNIVLDELKFDEVIRGADLIITGEGKTDSQSVMGKVISGVGNRGKKKQVPVIVISGALGDGYEGIFDCGVSAAFALYCNDNGLAWHMENAAQLMDDSVCSLFRFLAVTSKRS